VEDPFQQALNLGGGDGDETWFLKLWQNKILRTHFLEPDRVPALALAAKMNQARVNNEPSHIFSVVNKSPVAWTPMIHCEVVTGFCFLGRRSYNNQMVLAKKLFKCAGSIALIEIEAATPVVVGEDYQAYRTGHYLELFRAAGWTLGTVSPDLADNPQHLQYRLLVFHRSKKMKGLIDIEGPRKYYRTHISTIPVTVHQQITETDQA
jgi:hypothetical protein